MIVKEKNCNKILIVFLFSHLIIWTLIPSISNHNLPLDVIEAIAWSNGWPMGWDKHPPLSSWFPGFFFQIFGSQDWSYYFLSQIFLISSFAVVWKFSRNFLKNKVYSLISIFLLEGIYFYNFTTPEFNVNVCQLPFWALTIYYCWEGIKKNNILDWFLFGLFAALGLLSKYLFIYLLIAIDIFFIYLIFTKKFNFKVLFSLFSFFLILLPHGIWLVENNYITLTYALSRTSIDQQNIFNNIIHPLIFLFKQIGILIPFFIMLLFLISKLKVKIKFKDKKLLFLLAVNILPIALIFLTSLVLGTKIRTMWMTPFYLFIGVLFIYIYQNLINLRKLKNSFIIFLFLFIFSPLAYLYISISEKQKRTDYPGKEISITVQKNWNNNFSNKIESVIGDEWHAGNLSYHLESKPKWYSYSAAFIDISMEEFLKTIGTGGFIIVNGECDYGISFKVENNSICMYGKK